MRILVAMAVSVILMLGVAAPTEKVVAQGPPSDFSDTFTIDGQCRFPVLVELRGKSKAIELPGGRAILTSPAVTARLTNVDDPSKQTTQSITGAFHVTFNEDGSVEFVVTGRNLLIGFEPAFVIASGRFTFALDGVGNVIEPLSGKGRQIDVCELLE